MKKRSGLVHRGNIYGAYEGTLNIVNQAISLGIKKIIVTASVAALFDSDFKGAYGDKLVTEKVFGSYELEDIKPQEQDGPFIYQAAKTIADKKLQKIAQEHPDGDITAPPNPPVINWFPFVPKLSLYEPRISTLNSGTRRSFVL
ncbi:hypothetical protein MPER_11647 [Moniliophthora perniciosa FA553]|nr:hypothetical protein MPER_11647 [Moniliophthora perniciosa FA553]